MPPRNWGSVSLPEKIISDIDEFLEGQIILYTSRNEFVRHAVVEKLHNVGFYKNETEGPPRREEIHIEKDGSISHSIGKDDQSGKADSREKQVKVVELERIENLDEAVLSAAIEDSGEN